MATLFAGALVLGFSSSFLMGFVPFLIALLASILIGFTSAAIQGGPGGNLLLTGVSLLVSTQLAYGVGLLAQALDLSDRLPRRRGTPAPGGERSGRAKAPSDSAHQTLV